MIERQVDQLTFTEAHPDNEVFMSVRVVDEFVGILLTTSIHGDIDIYLFENECKQVVHALEEAARTIHTSNTREVTIMSLRAVRTTMEFVVKVRIERGLVIFDLAIEGNENEEDRVWVFLTLDQNRWLIEALRKALE
jgi:hypothetical protein